MMAAPMTTPLHRQLMRAVRAPVAACLPPARTLYENLRHVVHD